MYDEIIFKLEKQLNQDMMKMIKNRQLHLGIFTEPYLQYMLDGKKTVESRFSKNRIMPYNKIDKNDIIIVKKSSGPVVALIFIKNILFFDLNKNNIEEIKEKYQNKLCVNDEFWKLKIDSKYATLIEIGKIIQLNPFTINKKGMQTWIILKGEF